VAGTLLAGGLWVCAAVRWPWFRHLAAVGLGLIMTAAWMRSRPSHGRLRRLPPGSLGIGASLDALDNQRFYLDQAERFGPVFKTSEFGYPVICVIGLSRIRTILAENPTAFAGTRFTRPYNQWIPRGVIRYMDRGTHQEYAPRFRSMYGSLELAQAAPVLRNIYRRHLDRLVADTERRPEGVPVHGYVRRAMLEAIGYVLYGLAPGDPRTDLLERCMPLLNGPFRRKRGWQGATTAAMDCFRDVMKEQLSVGDLGRDGFRPALRILIDARADALEDPTIAGNFVLVSQIAYGDLTGLHMWIFKKLCDHPDALERLRSGHRVEVATGAEPDPAVRIVKETLRMEQSEFLFRFVTRTFEFQGMRIPAGSRMRFCIHESHRDPDTFPDPDRFDPDRFARRTFSRDEYAPFGLDAHGCMGSQIAHFLGGMFVGELASYDWRVGHDGPAEMAGNRHREHWRPNPALRVTMSSRRGAPR
jgi:cytochrome P450